MCLAPTVIYILEYYEGTKRHCISTGERDEVRAKNAARALVAGNPELEAAAALAFGPGDWTRKDALPDCYDRIWKHQKSAGQHLLRVNKLIRHEDATLIADMTYDWLVRLRQHIETWGISTATMNRYMVAISKALSEANMRGKLAALPKVPYTCGAEGKLR